MAISLFIEVKKNKNLIMIMIMINDFKNLNFKIIESLVNQINKLVYVSKNEVS